MSHTNPSGYKHLPRFAVATLFALGLMAATPAQAENLIVFKVTGINLTPGQSINGDQPLQLTAGQSVDLIAANGRIIKLTGPFNQPPSASLPADKSTLVASLKHLIASEKEDSSHLGITRSATSVLKSAGKDWVPDPWLINVTQPGNHCQRIGQPVVFWRPDGTKDVAIKLQVKNNTWKANTQWPEGSRKLAPPSSMPLKDGDIYQITLDKNTTDLTLKLIPSAVTAPPVQAAWMTESGCRAQSLALLRTIQ